jgi:hypothetical protein
MERAQDNSLKNPPRTEQGFRKAESQRATGKGLGGGVGNRCSPRLEEEDFGFNRSAVIVPWTGRSRLGENMEAVMPDPFADAALLAAACA